VTSTRAKTLYPVLVLACGLVAAAVLIVTRPEAETQPREIPAPMVRVIEVQPEQVQLRVFTHGTVAPRSESDLVPEVSGPVVWVSPALASGGFFAKDEPLLRIDVRDYEADLERSRANLARARSEHSRAVKQLKRRKGLARQDVASASQLDDAENSERVTAALLSEARTAVSQAERDLARTEIRAPYDGRVREENVDVGQFVTRGARIARLYSVDFAEVRLPVPDDQLGFLDLPLLGRPTEDMPDLPEVLLRADFAGANHTWRGRIVRTEGEIDPKSRMVHVVGRVSDPYAPQGDRPPLAVGLFVEAEILGVERDGVFVLPRSALRGADRVLVVDAEERLRFRQVDVLRTSRDHTLIQAGLEAGERVCVSPLEVAVDGMRVRAMFSEEPRS